MNRIDDFPPRASLTQPLAATIDLLQTALLLPSLPLQQVPPTQKVCSEAGSASWPSSCLQSQDVDRLVAPAETLCRRARLAARPPAGLRPSAKPFPSLQRPAAARLLQALPLSCPLSRVVVSRAQRAPDKTDRLTARQRAVGRNEQHAVRRRRECVPPLSLSHTTRAQASLAGSGHIKSMA